MKRLRFLMGFTLCCLCLSLGFAAPTKGEIKPSSDAKAQPFAVTIGVAETQIKAGKPFDVNLRIVNVSQKTQTFRAMTCSWPEHWKSSNYHVTGAGTTCRKNSLETITLKSGEAYEKTLSMSVDKVESPKPIAFRMGFTPFSSKTTYWSNVAVLQTATPTLAVMVLPTQMQVNIGEPFYVDLRVVNISKTPQSFRAMSCSWPQHWKSNNSRIVSTDLWPCMENFGKTIELQPGQAYEKRISMVVSDVNSPKTVAFKMGFTSLGSHATLWSNEVTLEVKEKTLAVMISVKNKTIRAGEPFDVSLHVVNVSQTPQSFYDMTCSWPGYWRSSNPKVDRPGLEVCYGNYGYTMTLKPGESYERTLSMSVPKGSGNTQIFKMGFSPSATSPRYKRFGNDMIDQPASTGSTAYEPSKITHWSNALVLQIRD